MIVLMALVGCSDAPTPGTLPTGDSSSVTTDSTTPPDPPVIVATGGIDTGPLFPDTTLRATPDPVFPTILTVTWEQPFESTTHVEFRADGGEWMTSPATVTPKGYARATILGVPYDARVDYRLVSDKPYPKGLNLHRTRQIHTAPLPATLIEPDMVASDPSGWDPSLPWILTSLNRDGESRRGRWWVGILDRNGRYVWALEGPTGYVMRHVSLAADGRAILVDRDTYWWGDSDASESTVVRMTLDGTIEHTYAVPGLHHAFTPIGGGDIAWAAKPQAGQNWSYETLYRVDRAGKQTEIWNCRDGTSTGGCGSNALWWDPSRDRLLFSSYALDSVFDIDIKTGATMAIFGRIAGSWAFDPPDSQFWWQHGTIYTDKGTLLVSTRDEQDRTDAETYIREYELDWKTKTLKEIWNFGVGRGAYSTNMGEAYRFPNGNSLHILGSGGRITETKPDQTVVWDADWNPGDIQCHNNPVGTTHCKHNGRTTALTDLYALLRPEE